MCVPQPQKRIPVAKAMQYIYVSSKLSIITAITISQESESVMYLVYGGLSALGVSAGIFLKPRNVYRHCYLKLVVVDRCINYISYDAL